MTLRIAALFLVASLGLTSGAAAHETDQFTVPVGKTFADLGDYFDEMVYDTLEASVNRANDRIRRAIATKRGPSRVAHLQSPDRLAGAVWSEFPSAYALIEGLETLTNSKRMQQRYPGQLIGFKDHFRNIYQKVHFPLDPRQFFRLWHASTLKVNGVYLGGDKVGHFTDMGYRYYQVYRNALEDGESHEQALAAAVKVGTNGLFFAETGMVGYFSAGAYSNGDLAANYVGLKFYLNLTQPVMLRGEMHPPLVVRRGDYWTLNEHVTRDSDFFAPFFDDHFNEALNPSLFEAGMRNAVRDAVLRRADNLMHWYADVNGVIRPRSYFDDMLAGFRTYYGEDYGYRGEYDELICIGNTSYGEAPNLDNEALTADGDALHWAVLLGDVSAVHTRLAADADPNQPLSDAASFRGEPGETPLHIAAGVGRIDLVRMLLDAGADVNAATASGATPLHRATRERIAFGELVEAGADLDATDIRGRTALNWAVGYGNIEAARELIARGAEIEFRDERGRTPLFRAVSISDADMLDLLIRGGANTNAAAALGLTPLHLAIRNGDTDVTQALLNNGAAVSRSDDFGWAPMHEAARAGRVECVSQLCAFGASAHHRDAYGSTPLHQAARYGHEDAARALVAGGANVSAGDQFGSTPLHEAAAVGHEMIVSILLDHGANVLARNENGHSPAQLAHWAGYRPLAVTINRKAGSPPLPRGTHR